MSQKSSSKTETLQIKTKFDLDSRAHLNHRRKKVKKKKADAELIALQSPEQRGRSSREVLFSAHLRPGSIWDTSLAF